MATTLIRVADGVSEQKNTKGDTWYSVTLDSVQTAITNAGLPAGAKITNARLVVEAHYTGALNLAKIYVYAGWSTSTSSITYQYVNGDRIGTSAANYYSGYILTSIFNGANDYRAPFTLNKRGCSYLTVWLKTANVTARKHFIDDVYIEVTYEIVPKYTVSLTPGTGCASVSGGGSYFQGDSATISCTSLPGYDIGASGIVRWQDSAGNIVFDYTPHTFNVYQNYSLTCNLYPNVYWIEYKPGFYGDYIDSSATRSFSIDYDKDFTIHSNTFFKANTNHPITINFQDGDTITPVVKYREFDNWYSENTTAYYSPGQVVRNLTTTHGKTIVLTAQWKAPYFIMPTPGAKEGYEFIGWEYRGTIYPPGASFKPQENLVSTTIVAVWNRLKIEDVYGGNTKAGVYVSNTECKAVYVGNTKVYG